MNDEMKRIARMVADHYDVPYGRIVACREDRGCTYQSKSLVEARHVAMWLIRHCTTASYPIIGRFFHLDHSTVVSACKKLDREFPASANAFVDRVMFPSAVVGHA